MRLGRYKASDDRIHRFFLHLHRVLNWDERQAKEYARAVEAFGRHLERSYKTGEFTNLYRASSHDVLDYIDYLERELKQKPGTIQGKIYSIRKFFRHEVKHKRLALDPTEGVPLPEIVETAKTTLGPQEFEKLLAAASRKTDRYATRNLALLHVLFSGIGKMEIENLTSRDFNRHARTLQVGAGRRQRRVLKLSPAAVDALEAYIKTRPEIEGSEPLFLAQSRKALSGRQIWVILRELGEVAGFKRPITAQSIRRSSAVNKLLVDPNLIAVQEALGLKRLQTTVPFAAKALELKHQAAGLDALVAEDVSDAFDSRSRTRVLNAIDKFISKRASHSQRRDAVRDLGDVLERYRAEAKALLPHDDERDLFNILNNFGIRHDNETQKIEYDPIWLSALFYHYLNMIHVLGSLMERESGLNAAS